MTNDHMTLTIVPWVGPTRTLTDLPEVIGDYGQRQVDDRLIRSAYVDVEGERHWFKRDGRFDCGITRIP